MKETGKSYGMSLLCDRVYTRNRSHGLKLGVKLLCLREDSTDCNTSTVTATPDRPP